MSMSDTLTVERRLGRVSAIMNAMQCVSAAGDECQGDAAAVCGDLNSMATEEMTKALSALGTEVLNRDC